MRQSKHWNLPFSTQGALQQQQYCVVTYHHLRNSHISPFVTMYFKNITYLDIWSKASINGTLNGKLFQHSDTPVVFSFFGLLQQPQMGMAAGFQVWEPHSQSAQPINQLHYYTLPTSQPHHYLTNLNFYPDDIGESIVCLPLRVVTAIQFPSFFVFWIVFLGECSVGVGYLWLKTV